VANGAMANGLFGGTHVFQNLALEVTAMRRTKTTEVRVAAAAVIPCSAQAPVTAPATVAAFPPLLRTLLLPSS
jgi:hypothetical protein